MSDLNIDVGELGQASQAIDRLANTYRAMVQASETLKKITSYAVALKELEGKVEKLRAATAVEESALEEAKASVAAARDQAIKVVADARAEAEAVVSAAKAAKEDTIASAEHGRAQILESARAGAAELTAAAQRKVEEANAAAAIAKKAADEAEVRRDAASRDLAALEAKMTAIKQQIASVLS